MGLVVLTGGSSGLGASLCHAYLLQGWSVVEFSRTAPYAFSVHVDLADSRASARAFADAFRPYAERNLSEVVGVNCAAILGPVGPVEHASLDAIAAHLDTNVHSGILFARAFVAAFQDHACPKSFVNVSSGAAVREHAGWSLYCASKAAMNSFVRAMALEQAVRAHPIGAFSVNPGVMDTRVQAEVRASSHEDLPDVDRYIHLHRDGALPSADNVASRIVDMIASRPEPGGFLSVP